MQNISFKVYNIGHINVRDFTVMNGVVVFIGYILMISANL